MKYVLATLRFIFFMIITLIFTVLLYISYYFLRIFGKNFSIRINYKMTMFIGLLLRFLLGIRVKVYGKEKIPKKSGLLIASNHLGYVELIALLKVLPVAFVAKEDIGKWPFIGAVATACGTVFVDRDRGGMSETYINKTANVLNNRINVWFSPEKTTTDGTWLRPFSSALFVASNRTKRPVVPVVFVLKKLNGKAIKKEDRVKIAWALKDNGEAVPFFKHFTHFMTFDRVHLEMHVLDPVVADYDDEDIKQRRAFSNMLRDKMSKKLKELEPEFDRERKYLNKQEANKSKT